MLFMIIERSRDNDMVPIYRHLRDKGRFQLMRCNDVRLLQEWTLQWRGLGATFEFVPVVSSKDTREIVAPYLDAPEPQQT